MRYRRVGLGPPVSKDKSDSRTTACEPILELKTLAQESSEWKSTVTPAIMSRLSPRMEARSAVSFDTKSGAYRQSEGVQACGYSCHKAIKQVGLTVDKVRMRESQGSHSPPNWVLREGI